MKRGARQPRREARLYYQVNRRRTAPVGSEKTLRVKAKPRHERDNRFHIGNQRESTKRRRRQPKQQRLKEISVDKRRFQARLNTQNTLSLRTSGQGLRLRGDLRGRAAGDSFAAGAIRCCGALARHPHTRRGTQHRTVRHVGTPIQALLLGVGAQRRQAQQKRHNETDQPSFVGREASHGYQYILCSACRAGKVPAGKKIYMTQNARVRDLRMALLLTWPTLGWMTVEGAAAFTLGRV